MLGSQLIREVQIDWNRIDRDRKPDLIILQSRSSSCDAKLVL